MVSVTAPEADAHSHQGSKNRGRFSMTQRENFVENSYPD
jgi:hypothetical protein